MYKPRYKRLLLRNANGTMRVLTHATQRHNIENNTTVQPEKNICQWIDLYRNFKQTGKIAHGWLKNHPSKLDYTPHQRASSLWIHKTQTISFTLILDDLRIKYSEKQDAHHLINALQKKYITTVD